MNTNVGCKIFEKVEKIDSKYLEKENCRTIGSFLFFMIKKTVYY